ncbi:MAG TPA: tetratricopeptide repeat protein, partial [Longimicrobium sp.]
GHIYNNLANVTHRLQRLDEAEVWFESAFRVWDAVSSPADLGICLHNYATLRETQERYDEAHTAYAAALRMALPAWLRATIATDFASWWLHEGHLTQAEEWVRVAEENAIATGSPYTLGITYLGRGKFALAREDPEGFIFFEKALEIAREKGYSSLEAETLAEYARLRVLTGGTEEAMAYLERACDIFREVGALGELERARAALDELRAGVSELDPAGETPLAAAGD